MSFTTFIALKYLRSKKSHRFFSFLSLISFIGIFISVSAFLIIHCVMTGFSNHLRQALIGFNAHVVVRATGDADRDREIAEWSRGQGEVRYAHPVVEFHGIIQTPNGSVAGAKVRGLGLGDLEGNASVRKIYFSDEREQSLKPDAEGLPGVLLGEELYARLQFIPGEQERVFLVYPFGDVGPTGEVEPRRRQFRVVGVMKTGFYDFDTQYALVDLPQARRLAGTEADFTEALIGLESMAATEAFQEKIRARFPDASTVSWEARNQRLFQALKLERFGMFLLLSIVTFIASFNILGLMSLLVVGKSREMALFYSLGATRGSMQRIFRRLGAYLGLFGTACGLAAGLGAVYLLREYPLPLPPAYYLEFLPVQVDLRMTALLAFMAPFFTILASAWPAYQASRVNPVELLRET